MRNQDGTAPWSTVRDVTFTNNIVRHSGGGVNMMGTDYLHPSQPTQRVLIQNNLFDDIGGTWNGTGTFVQILDGGSDVVVDHNTVLQSGNMITATYSSALVPATSFVFTNNIVSYNQYGVFGDYGIGLGMRAINAYFPGSSFARNAIVGGLASNFPADNYVPSALAAVGFVDLANRNYALAPALETEAPGGFTQFTAGANGPLRIAGLTQSFAISNPATVRRLDAEMPD